MDLLEAVLVIGAYIVAGVVGLVFLYALLRHIYAFVAAVLFLGSLVAIGYGALIIFEDLQRYLDLEQALSDQWVLNKQWGMVFMASGALVLLFVIMDAVKVGALKVRAYAKGVAASEALKNGGKRNGKAGNSAEEDADNPKGGGPWG